MSFLSIDSSAHSVGRKVGNLLLFGGAVCLEGPSWQASVFTTPMTFSPTGDMGGGPPGQFVAAGLTVATNTAGAQFSSDGGATWSLAATPPVWGGGFTAHSVAFGNGLWVMDGTNAVTYATSPDMNVWTDRAKTGGTSHRVTFAAATFFFGNTSNSTRRSLTGIPPLLAVAMPAAVSWQGVAAAPNGLDLVWVASGATNTARSSDGGVTWVAGGVMPFNAGWSTVAYGNGRFVALPRANDNRCAVSTDNGVTWQLGGLLPAVAQWQTVIFADGVFMVTGGSATVPVSLNGVAWLAAPNPMPSVDLWRIATDNIGHYAALASAVGTTSAAFGIC